MHVDVDGQGRVVARIGFDPERTDAAAVRLDDLQEVLLKSGVDLLVNGAPRTNFSYNANSGTLSYTAGTMKEGRHSVKITATDPQGAKTSRNWTFRVN